METKPLLDYFTGKYKEGSGGHVVGWWPQAKLLNFIGLWPVNKESSSGLTMYSYILFIPCILAKILHVIDAINSLITGNFKILVNQALCLAIDLWFVIRWITLSFHSREFSQIINDIEKMTATCREYVPEETEKEMTMRWRRCKIAFFLFTVQPFTFCLHWLFWPLVNRLIFGELEFIIDNSSLVEKYTLYFDLYYAGEVANFLLSLYCVTVYESYFITCIEMLTAHYRILSKELQAMGQSTVADLKKTVTMSYYFNHHQEILRICLKLKKLTSPILVCHSFATVVIICVSVFALTQLVSELSHSKFMNFVELSGGAVFHFFVISYICEKLTEESLNAPLEVYNIKWYEKNFKMSDRKSMLIMMTTTELPIVMGGFIPIGLSSFLTMMKTAFSYYNFLTAVQ